MVCDGGGGSFVWLERTSRVTLASARANSHVIYRTRVRYVHLYDRARARINDVQMRTCVRARVPTRARANPTANTGGHVLAISPRSYGYLGVIA